MNFIHQIGMAIFMSLGMFWQVGWSLALGFTIAAVIQAVVPKESIVRKFGKSGIKEVALATGFGAISSSCSYAAASTSRALFKKGASFISSMAFLFASTNLVIELGIILFLLMGWQFAVAEWIGGIVLIAIMSLLVKAFYPRKIIEGARIHQEQDTGHTHHEMKLERKSFWQMIKTKEARVAIAQNFVMEWSMLQKDLIVGFLIAGVVAVFIPHSLWNILFLKGSSPVVRITISALIGPIIAMLTFVCSIGNVPLAAIFWSQGMNFAGVLSFLYADLIVIPLLAVYKKYYGWKMMWYILGIFFATMVLTGLIMYVPFAFLHQIPSPTGNIQSELTQFSFNYTFWLNLIFASIVIYFIYLNIKNPMHHESSHCEHHG